MIRRDGHSIICQHDIYSTTGAMDAGDSASRTGIMALCGSKLDIIQLREFIVMYNELVRHPYDKKWSDPRLTSRDQLVMYSAGLYKNYPMLASRLQRKHKLKINKDIVTPDVQNHLRRCANMRPTVLGNLWLIASIIWGCKIAPREEQNQLICMVVVAGGWFKKLYLRLHPNIDENMRKYWGGWRDQPEIGAALLQKLRG